MKESAGNSVLPKRKPLRLGGYDYTAAGHYFVTVCTWRRHCLFGEVVAGTMRLNELAVVITSSWLETPRRFPSVSLDAFVVMPNHIHGILVLNEHEPGAMNRAPTLGDVVRSFKACCSRAWKKSSIAAQSDADLWQRGYHEHVIRNEQDLARVREYIANNPLQWAIDRENPGYCSSARNIPVQ